ncbi:hypothetical protein IWQ60_010577 [Tieghemiomyces parasiticus]|uniref:Uncharacterized protein n=1 Tax=Tieghemiomyces parasiticus TaxID=78921 RepID=A0A9W7ZJE8_9FUNG|nr:hypothetical protein IWQ60_010577 [Tieghemiomyces parasiticus]
MISPIRLAGLARSVAGRAVPLAARTPLAVRTLRYTVLNPHLAPAAPQHRTMMNAAWANMKALPLMMKIMQNPTLVNRLTELMRYVEANGLIDMKAAMKDPTNPNNLNKAHEDPEFMRRLVEILQLCQEAGIDAEEFMKSMPQFRQALPPN